jgi:glycosyltransferase involved in cell wall biosynthesis
MGCFVAQIGARWYYLVPRILAAHRLLSGFATDFWCGQWIGVVVDTLAKFRMLPSVLRRAGSRRDALVPNSLVYDFPWFAWRYAQVKRRARTQGDLYAAYCWGGENFCRLASRVVPRQSRAVYAFTSAAQELFEMARDHHIPCILDHASGFITVESAFYQQQWVRYPHWGSPRERTAGMDQYAERQRRELALADIVLVPSTFARDCLLRAGADSSKIVVLPLGLPLGGRERIIREQSTGPLKVLFVGRQALLKGVPDLVAALRLMSTDRLVAKVVGVGEVPGEAKSTLPKNIEFVGEVSRTDVKWYYRWADVLVFPTVSDTFGFVILEALASGLAVIASTHSAAPDIIRPGQEGFVLPPMRPDLIAECLDRLCTDRKLLLDMQRAALARFEDYTELEYAGRLLQVLRETVPGLEG